VVVGVEVKEVDVVVVVVVVAAVVNKVFVIIQDNTVYGYGMNSRF